MLIGDGQMCKAVGGDELTNICYHVFNAGQFADAMLGRNLPSGGRADVLDVAVVLDRVQRFLR